MKKKILRPTSLTIHFVKVEHFYIKTFNCFPYAIWMKHIGTIHCGWLIVNVETLLLFCDARAKIPKQLLLNRILSLRYKPCY